MHRTRCLAKCLAALSLVVLLVHKHATATTFLADTRCADFTSHFTEGLGPVNASCSVTNYPVELWGPSANPIRPIGSATADSFASASAAPSGLSASSIFLISAAGAESGDRGASTQTYAAWNFDDFIITGPGTAPVMSALNLHVSGSLGGSGSTDNQGQLTTFVNGGGSFFIDIELNDRFAGTGFADYSWSNGSIRQVAGDLLEDHGGTSGTIFDFITTEDLLLPVGQGFTMFVEITANSRGGIRIIGTPADEFDSVTVNGGGFASFSNTVSFPTSGPVFNLPPGYTINSVSAGIVNNQFVPEPSTFLLAALAAASMGWFNVRCRLARRLSDS